MKNYENIIIVKSQTRLERLKTRFNTLSNARFYLERQQQIQSFEDLLEEDYCIRTTVEFLYKNLTGLANLHILDRQYLPNYVFGKKDVILVVGQDGLVANTAKYAPDIPIVGINPDSNRYDGILLPFQADTGIAKVRSIFDGKSFQSTTVTMAEACLDDGQRLLAFNDLFIGPKTHTSARYLIKYRGQEERQSSSGIIVSTGAGSTGWMSSLLNMAKGIQSGFNQAENQMQSTLDLTLPWEARQLLFAVREPFRSRTSGVNLVAGAIDDAAHLQLESQMPDNGVIFSDGIQEDFLTFTSGRIAKIGIAKESALLVA
jgi:NAD kinase